MSSYNVYAPGNAVRHDDTAVNGKEGGQQHDKNINHHIDCTENNTHKDGLYQVRMIEEKYQKDNSDSTEKNS